MTEEDLGAYLSSDLLIEMVKAQHNIEKPSSEMTDDEIADVMKFLGSGAPDTVWTDEGPILRRLGIGIMLSLTLYEFPEFYERYELSQLN